MSDSWVELMPGIGDALILSYEAEGWLAERGSDRSVELIAATSDRSIDIRPNTPDALISVTVTGVCVLTAGAGAGSDEATMLEESVKGNDS